MDILELVFIVLMQATEDADADLRLIMEEVKQRNQRLCRWRELLAKLETHRASGDGELLRSASAVIAGQVDSFSDMAEQMQLRLQMAMDRRSKFIDALSNLMKKQSDTANALVSNLK